MGAACLFPRWKLYSPVQIDKRQSTTVTVRGVEKCYRYSSGSVWPQPWAESYDDWASINSQAMSPELSMHYQKYNLVNECDPQLRLMWL